MSSRSTKRFALATLLAASVLVACGDEDTVVEDAEEEGFPADVAILGEPVTVQAPVEEVVGPNVFTVGEGDTTLVVGAGVTEGISEGRDVQVTGTVREFVLVDIEELLGLDFEATEESFVDDYEERLAIVAEDVSVLP